MGKLRALRWLSLVGLLMVIWPAPGANATIYEVLNDSNSYGDLQADDPGLGGNGIYYLGPIAAVNSFVYPENRYQNIYNHSLIPVSKVDTALTLAQSQYMNTSLFTGTQVPDFYWGKYLYIEAQVPGKTIYAGETTPQTWGSRGQPSWVTQRDSGPTWGFIYNQLVKGADVELLLGVSGLGVYVTLTGFHFDDGNGDGIIDNGETAWIKYFDPTTGTEGQSNLWNNPDGTLSTSYGGGCLITMAASESPVPLPSTLLFFGSGILGLWGIGRRRTANRG